MSTIYFFGLVEFLFPFNVTLLRLSDPTNTYNHLYDKKLFYHMIIYKKKIMISKIKREKQEKKEGIMTLLWTLE